MLLQLHYITALKADMELSLSKNEQVEAEFASNLATLIPPHLPLLDLWGPLNTGSKAEESFLQDCKTEVKHFPLSWGWWVSMVAWMQLRTVGTMVIDQRGSFSQSCLLPCHGEGGAGIALFIQSSAKSDNLKTKHTYGRISLLLLSFKAVFKKIDLVSSNQ